jgi:hypothetical protein
MKRLLMCSLAVSLSAGVASAQVDNLTLWLADAEDGDSHLVFDMLSDTAVLQLWMEIPAGMQLINVDAILQSYDADFGKEVCFEVDGFIDHGPWGEDPDHDGVDAFGRTTRGGPFFGPGVDGYQYVAEDANFPMDAWSGVFGPATILLDEVVLHLVCIDSLGAPDLVYFGFPPANPGGFELLFGPSPPWPPPGQWIISQLAVVDLLNGTLDNPFLVEYVPEPGMLSLGVLAGLAVVRRRR